MASATPDPGSLRELRREREGTIRTLPRERVGALPRWPLTKATARERAVWRDVWTLPQAVVWEEQRMFRQVGMYVRTSVEAEEPGATSSLRSVILRQETNLLLVESALLRAGYRISAFNAPAATPATAKGGGRPVVDVRGRWQQDRLRALESIPDARSRLRPQSGDADA